MLARTGPQAAVVHAPAKLNLYFELLSRRTDGYHDVETLMVPVSLFDTLFFTTQSTPASPEGSGEIDFECTLAGGDAYRNTAAAIPTGSDNIVVRTLELLRQRSGTNQGAVVRLVKRIPAAAGLGGGSSDAAAALLAANEVWALGWSRQQLASVAAEVGSDVAFFLWNKPTVCRGRGEQLDFAPGIGDVHAVIVHPPQGLSTAEVYRRCQVPAEPRCVEPLLDALRSGSKSATRCQMHNRLQETAENMSPWIGRLQQEFAATGCSAHQMTGSGSSYFGICHHARHARRVAARLRSRKLGSVFTVRRAG